jgi:hypothetical protein
MHETLRTDRLLIVVGTLLLGVWFVSVSVAGDCTAELEVELSHKDQNGALTHLQFSVNVRTTAECAKIHYDLIVEELLPNGQTKRVRLPRYVKLSDGSEDDIVEHETELTMQSYEVQLVSCDGCEMGI